MDIAAPLGTKVHSVLPGIVTKTGSFLLAGNSVIIDHGHGLVSSYSHLSKINVTEGQKLKARDIIGEVGATGRATGNHLHWGLASNKNLVNPRLFL